MRAVHRTSPWPLDRRRRARLVVVSLAVLVSASWIGCGDRGAMRKVAGEITVDGTALEEGTIGFAPLDGKGPTAGTTIRSGHYEVEMLPGKKRVSIEGFRTGGPKRRDSYPGMADRQSKVQFLPSRYNSESTLEVEIADENEPVSFALNSK